MKDASQQQTDPRSSGAHCPIIPTHRTRGLGNAAFRAAAAGLGLLAGVAFLISGCRATVAPAPPKPVAENTQPSAPIALPASNPAPVSPVDSKKKTGAAPKLSPSAHGNSTRKGSGTGHKNGDRELLAANNGAVEHKSAKRAPYVPATPAAPASVPTALDLATSAAAAGPFIVCIEGDVTVANYDVASGTVETFERQSYTLGNPAGEGSAIPWQDFPFNVHYRCDQVGNCTLFRRGLSANARLVR